MGEAWGESSDRWYKSLRMFEEFPQVFGGPRLARRAQVTLFVQRLCKVRQTIRSLPSQQSDCLGNKRGIGQTCAGTSISRRCGNHSRAAFSQNRKLDFPTAWAQRSAYSRSALHSRRIDRCRTHFCKVAEKAEKVISMRRPRREIKCAAKGGKRAFAAFWTEVCFVVEAVIRCRCSLCAAVA
jgi:hypothetical protein